MKLILLASLLSTVVHCFGFASPAAGALSVTGSTGLVWDGGPSPTMTLQIKNNSAIPETLLTYQIELQLVPASGASGTLNFNTAAEPSSGYVFQLGSLLDPSFTGPGTLIENFTDIDLFGVPMASGDSSNLVTLDFDDSDVDTPSGLFFVELIPFDTDETSFYTTLLSGGETAFEDAGSGAAPLVVGSITLGNTVVVPEPSAGGLFGLALGIGLSMMTSRWSRCRWREERLAGAAFAYDNF